MKNKLLMMTVVAFATAAVTAVAADGDKKPKKPADPATASARLIKQGDTDSDGALSAEEFAATKMGQNAAQKGGDEAVSKAFARWDSDSDGKATQAEIQAAMEKRAKNADKAKKKGEG